jgi:hypothetical protein
MVRSLASSLVAIVISLGSLSAASAQFPLPPASGGAVSHEEMLGFLRSLDQDARFIDTEDGSRIYSLTLRARDGVQVPLMVIVRADGISIVTPLSGPVDASRVSDNTRIKLQNLNGRPLATKFILVNLQQGKVALVGVNMLKRSVTLDQFKQGIGQLFNDRAGSAQDWAPIVRDIA